MWAAAYVGLPYAEADCWDLARRVLAEQRGIYVPRELTLEEGKAVATEVTVPQEFDLVLMYRLGRPHIGVMVGRDRMLHTTSGKNAVIERISRFRFRVAGYFRI